MKRMRKSIQLAGILFILATIGSILGGTMISAAVPNTSAGAVTTANRMQLISGILLELLNAVCVAGIGALLAPAIRLGSDRAATGYAVWRTIEAVFCGTAVFAPLAMLYSAGAPAGFTAELFAMRAGIYGIMIPLCFSIGALVLYGSMYRLRLVPRFISVWGFIATVFVLIATFAGFVLPNGLSENVPLMLGLPIILNELFFGGWLIAKGMKEPVAV